MIVAAVSGRGRGESRWWDEEEEQEQEEEEEEAKDDALGGQKQGPVPPALSVPRAGGRAALGQQEQNQT